MSREPGLGYSGKLRTRRDARADYYYYSDKIVNSTWRARAAYCALVIQVGHFVTVRISRSALKREYVEGPRYSRLAIQYNYVCLELSSSFRFQIRSSDLRDFTYRLI